MDGLNTLLLAIVLVALVGHLWTPHDPLDQAFREAAREGPSWHHWLGVDPLGRDFGSRLWAGMAQTIGLALQAAALTFVICGGLLFLDQRFPRLFESLLRLLMGIWVAVPVVLMSLILLVVFSPSPGVLILAAALGSVPTAFRQMRVLWREQISLPYVDASRVLGASDWRLFARTLFPNLLPDWIGLGKLVFAIAVLELSGLAFLGLAGDPDLPELGAILRQNQANLLEDPLFVVLPGLMLSGLLLLVHLSRRRSS